MKKSVSALILVFCVFSLLLVSCGKDKSDDSDTLLFYKLNSEGTGYTVSNIVTVKSAASKANNRYVTNENIVIPSEFRDLPVIGIDSLAFADCKGVESITVPAGITQIGDQAFACCDVKEIIFEDGSKLESIGNGAFHNCDYLTDITIPEGVKSIGYDAFGYCTRLADITLPSGVTAIEDYAFQACSELTEITIPDGVRSIGDYAFVACSKLASVTMPSDVDDIGDYAFADCIQLVSISISKDVESIGDYAFVGCSELSSIKIPSGVKRIGDMALYGCGLENIYYEGTEAEWNKLWQSEWRGLSNNCKITYNYGK